MILLPYENFYIITKLKPEEVDSKLQQEVSPPRPIFNFSLFSSSQNTYFEGYAANGTFEIKRAINYRNSFLPQIKGTIEAWPGGSRVHIKMSMMILVTIFMCFWLSFAAIAGFAFLNQEINKEHYSAGDFAPFGMFFFGYALAMGGFKYESRKAKAFLMEMLDGKI